ncbi:S-layer homology domain-containing protein [Paenibacillus illinoisensis]|uniref:S-layer homology domain-containing protein n=1 Tax=Paenibacillus illinoisensis TaxID=59845 RepID=UPI003D2E1405
MNYKELLSNAGGLEINYPLGNTELKLKNNVLDQFMFIRILSKGYFKGYADGTFKPNAPGTKEKFAVLLSRVSSNDSKRAQSLHLA